MNTFGRAYLILTAVMLKVHQIIGITDNGDIFNEDVHVIIVVRHLYTANPDTQCEKKMMKHSSRGEGK